MSNSISDPVGLFGYTTLITGLVVLIVAVLYKLTKNIRDAEKVVLAILVTIVGGLILALFVFVLTGVIIR